MPTVIPLQAVAATCPRCATATLNLNGLHLEPHAVHGVTERFDPQGQVVGYDQLPVYPPHQCSATI